MICLDRLREGGHWSWPRAHLRDWEESSHCTYKTLVMVVTLTSSSILMDLQQKGGTVSRAMMGEWEMKERAGASGRVEEMGEEDKSMMEEVAVNCMTGQAKQMKEALLMYSMLEHEI